MKVLKSNGPIALNRKFVNSELIQALLMDTRFNLSLIFCFTSTAACTVLEREPAPPHIIIRLSWNLLTRLQIIEIAKMLLVFLFFNNKKI